MTSSVLHVVSRPQRSPRALRVAGSIPAVVYGHGVPTQSVAVDRASFLRVWKSAGESSLVDLAVDEQNPVKVIIQDLQFDPRTSAVSHIDFHQVRMTEKVEVDVDLVFSGEAPAAKEMGGTLVKVLTAISVECLPVDLVKEISVDVSVLTAFDAPIHVRDLTIPAGLTVKNPPDDVVVQVEAPRTEEEIAELATAVEEDVSKVEKVEKPKAEEEAAAAPAEEK